MTGLEQDVRAGSDRAAAGAALFAAVAVGAATLETQWATERLAVAPDEAPRPLYDALYGQFRELALTTQPQAHALAAWRREHER